MTTPKIPKASDFWILASFGVSGWLISSSDEPSCTYFPLLMASAWPSSLGKASLSQLLSAIGAKFSRQTM
jgi:hypothetical protein